MSEQEKIIERIQKLLEFQHGANAIDSPEEAANAAEKVQRLLMKHNLSMADIGERKEKSKVTKQEFEDIVPRKNESTWIFDLYSALCKYNFCKFLIYQGKRLDLEKRKLITIQHGMIIGEEENILMIKFLGEQLEIRLRAMARKSFSMEKRFISEKKNTYIRGYLRGAVNGIRVQLREAQEREMQAQVKVTDLVHVKSDAVEKYIKEELGPLSKGRSSSLSGMDGAASGYRDGRSMSINQGVGGGNKSSGKLNQ